MDSAARSCEGLVERSCATTFSTRPEHRESPQDKSARVRLVHVVECEDCLMHVMRELFLLDFFR